MVRVVFAEDNYLVREAVTRLLESEADIEVAGVCEDFDGLLACIHEDDREQLRARLAGARLDATNYDLELRLHGSDGILRWVHALGQVGGRGDALHQQAREPAQVIGHGGAGQWIGVMQPAWAGGVHPCTLA